MDAERKDIQMKLKDLNRQHYFTTFEQRRKQLIVKQIDDELQVEKQRKKMKKQFVKVAKEKVLLIPHLNDFQAAVSW